MSRRKIDPFFIALEYADNGPADDVAKLATVYRRACIRRGIGASPAKKAVSHRKSRVNSGVHVDAAPSSVGIGAPMTTEHGA